MHQGCRNDSQSPILEEKKFVKTGLITDQAQRSISPLYELLRPSVYII